MLKSTKSDLVKRESTVCGLPHKPMVSIGIITNVCYRVCYGNIVEAGVSGALTFRLMKLFNQIFYIQR